MYSLMPRHRLDKAKRQRPEVLCAIDRRDRDIIDGPKSTELFS